MQLTYIKLTGEGDSDSDDQYTGLNCFGEVIDHRWIDLDNSDADMARIQYGYNKAGLRNWRLDAVAEALGKKYDDLYAYNNLAEVTSRKRGTLNGSRDAINGTPAQQETWDYDPAGNWKDYDRADSGSTTIDQTRQHNTANEITQFDGSATPVAYDAAGNMTRVPESEEGTEYREMVWDAWNRLKKVRTPAGQGGGASGSGYSLEVEYEYDGLTRRTKKIVTSGGVAGTTHFYYNQQWKVIEERLDASITADKQYIYGARGRNDLVFRDADLTGTPARHYALCDNMGSKIALTDDSGTVQQRYAFTAFGQASTLDADFDPLTSGAIEWETLFHGEMRDDETGYYNYGYRYYLPQLGRWPNRDPLDVPKRVYLYTFVANSPCNMNDLLGLFEDGLRVEANSKLIERNWLLKDEIEVWLHFEFSAYCDKNGNEKIFIETPKVLKDNGDKNDVDAGGVVIHPTECDLSWIRDQDRFGLLVAWRVNSEALDSLLSEGTALGLGGVGALAGLSRGLGGAAAGGTVGGIAGWAIGGAIELTYDEEWEWGFERVWKICCVCTSDNQWKLIIDEKDRINSLDATRGGTFEAEHTGGYPRTAR